MAADDVIIASHKLKMAENQPFLRILPSCRGLFNTRSISAFTKSSISCFI